MVKKVKPVVVNKEELLKRKEVLLTILDKKITATNGAPGGDESNFIDSVEKDIQELNQQLGINDGPSSSYIRFKNSRHNYIHNIWDEHGS